MFGALIQFIEMAKTVEKLAIQESLNETPQNYMVGQKFTSYQDAKKMLLTCLKIIFF